ncbi:ParB/RepB/Spo0J family partition protein [Alienimonas californiensis]|nr:ParB/RepB/Spo0J family partition protein [Alienimonas californiensis]
MSNGKYASFAGADLDADFRVRPESTPDSAAFAKPAGPGRVEGQERLRNAAKIPLTEIVADAQVREDFDPEELAKLAHSIQTQGQLQPVRVRWDEGRGKYVLIVGERRFRACQIAGIEKLECVIQEGEIAADDAHELQLIENIVRQDLNPIEEAKAYRKLIDGRGCSAKEMAAELSLDYTTVQRSLRLLTLPEDVQERVAEGVIPKSLFREVLKLKTDEERRAYVDRYLDGGTIDAVAAEVKRKKGGDKPAKQKSTRRFTKDGLVVQASKTGRITTADLIATLKAWAEELEADLEKRRATAA